MAAVRMSQESPWRWRIEPEGAMRVPGVVFASADLLPAAVGDRALEQVANVATLPGIVDASYAMPDIHWGYGFPIGGVAATDIAAGGVVSPGGVGFDISCGVRLLAARDLDRGGLARRLGGLMDVLSATIPRGTGPGGLWSVTEGELSKVLLGGSAYAVHCGHGVPRDLDRCEDGGVVADADPAQVGGRALARGSGQIGSLGSGNHFLEIQVVDDVYDEAAAAAMGLRRGQIAVMIHCGSRGLGHQICTDHVRVMDSRHAPVRHHRPGPAVGVRSGRLPAGPGISGRDGSRRQLRTANRQLLSEAVRRAFTAIVGVELDLVYDVSHNLAKIESHRTADGPRRLCVHRKGATRALPPGHRELPADLRQVGQPVFIPGTMGTASYVLAGVAGNPAFASTPHGAGRVQSRHAASRGVSGRALCDDLERAGVLVRGASWRGLTEEAPSAYKDVTAVVDTSTHAGLARKVARLVPLGVVKG